MSMATVSSVYGPEVSYSRTGGSPPDSVTSRNGTPPTISLFEPGNAPRVMERDLSRMGLFIVPLPTPV